MKKVAAKIITIFSQLLVASVFLFLLFSGETRNSNDRSVVVNNNNFNKMADKTLFLFNSLETKDEEADSNVVVELTSVDKVEEPAIKEVKQETIKEEVKEESPKKEETSVTPLEPDFSDKKVLETFTGSLTGYGPDCDGCIGITASGYDVRNTIYYNDKTYNNVRVLAADKSLPFGTIIKVSNLKDYNDFIGIVLDRGSAISFDGFSQIDLLFESEDYSYNFGRKENVIFEILRLGY